jgi:hypothetical protein
MKSVHAILALALLLGLAACGKRDDAAHLQREAVAVARYYHGKFDHLEQRVQAIFVRGNSIPGNLPGIEEVQRRLAEARDKLIELRGIVAPGPDGKSAVQKQAEAAAKDGKVDDLRKLLDDTKHLMRNGTIVINDHITAVESWIAYYDLSAIAR